MLVLKDIGINISFEYSLINKKTARCPEQYIGHDEKGIRYLVVHASTRIQSFYAQRAVKKQKELSELMPLGMNCNFPIYNQKKEDGFYAVYQYFKDTHKIDSSVPDNWIKKVYKLCSKRYSITSEIIEKIENDLLSMWPKEFYTTIRRLDKFQKLRNELQSLDSILICFQHGDFTPNNILRCENDKYYLIDFEFALSFQPIGFDLFDYHYASDKIFEDIPYLEINRLKEELINEVNQMIDNHTKAFVCRHKISVSFKTSWADNMIYNRPDLFENNKAKQISIKYGSDVYNIRYTLNGYRATLHIWLRALPANVVDEAVNYIFKYHYNVVKIEIHCAQTNVHNQLNVDNNWVITLPETSSEIFNRLGKKSKYNFKREQRLLSNQAGELKYSIYDEAIPKEIISTYFNWKKETHGTDYGLSENEYLEKYHVNGGMTLSAGDRLVSILFYCINNKTVYLENISYNTEFNKYSPGFLLYEYFLEEMTRKNLMYVFLGNGVQSYKTRFDSTEYLVYSGIIYRNKIVKILNTLERKINVHR